jgi:hypothetical protein
MAAQQAHERVAEEEARLKQELAECTLRSSWLYTAGAVAVAVPVGVRRRRAPGGAYAPLAVAAMAGTMLDLLAARRACAEQRGALERWQAERERQL